MEQELDWKTAKKKPALSFAEVVQCIKDSEEKIKTYRQAINDGLHGIALAFGSCGAEGLVKVNGKMAWRPDKPNGVCYTCCGGTNEMEVLSVWLQEQETDNPFPVGLDAHWKFSLKTYFEVKRGGRNHTVTLRSFNGNGPFALDDVDGVLTYARAYLVTLAFRMNEVGA